MQSQRLLVAAIQTLSSCAPEQLALPALCLQAAAPGAAGDAGEATAPAGEAAAEPAAAASAAPAAAAADAQPKLTEAEKARLRALRFGLPLADDKEGGKGGKAAAKGEAAATAIGGLGQVSLAARRRRVATQHWRRSLGSSGSCVT